LGFTERRSQPHHFDRQFGNSPVPFLKFHRHFVGFPGESLANDLEIDAKMVALGGHPRKFGLVGGGPQRLVGQAVPLCAKFNDAFLEVGKIGLSLLENLLQLGEFVRFSGELPLKIGRQFLRLHHIVLECFVIRCERATQIRIYQS
jgi:hypothetical protein